MDYILQQLSHLDLGQILVMGVMLWVMYTRILSKMDKLEDKLSGQIQKVDDKLSAQIQKLDEKVTDIDRRVCRMEGAFNNKECCMIKDSSQLKKAE
jgi:hypothetical protein